MFGRIQYTTSNLIHPLLSVTPVHYPMVISPFGNPEKSTSFFSSPYRPSPSNLSPVPENPSTTRESSSLSSPSNSDSHSPLLPISGHVERGRYPFPTGSNQPTLLSRVRVAMTGKAMARNWALKRLLWVAVLGGVLLLVFRHDRDGVCGAPEVRR